MTQDELDGRLAQMRQQLFSLRFQLSTGQLEQTNQISSLKKDIARALTIKQEMKRQNA